MLVEPSKNKACIAPTAKMYDEEDPHNALRSLPSPPTEDKAFHFLGLPQGVRLTLYKIAIKEEYKQRFWYLNDSAETFGIWLYFRNKSPVSQPALSKVNRQMRKEALDVFWAFPRICYPYIKQLGVPDLQTLSNHPHSQSRLAPQGLAALKQFSMYWNFAIAGGRGDSKREYHYAIVARVIVHPGRFPAARIFLKTSEITDEMDYDDGFMNDTLSQIGVSTPSWRREAQKGSGRRWTYAKFEVEDAPKLLQKLHSMFRKYDQGPSHTAEVEGRRVLH